MPRLLRGAGGVVPAMSPWATIHESAVLTGNIRILDDAVVGPRAVIRGDTAQIVVGPKAKIEQEAVLTASHNSFADPVTGIPLQLVVGPSAQIGKGAVLDSCIVEGGAVIGERAVVGRGAIVEAGAKVGDDTVVPPGRRVPAKEEWKGNPATFVGLVGGDH